MDKIHRFSFPGIAVRGQWVRLGRSLSEAFDHRDYPDWALHTLAQMLAAVTLSADNLKFAGSVTLQVQGDGHIRRALAECRERHLLRAIAQIAETNIPTTVLHKGSTLRDQVGEGRLAISLLAAPSDVRPGETGLLSQGLVELTAPDLATNLEAYFLQSEQLETRLFLSSRIEPQGPIVTGLLMQRLPQDKAAQVSHDRTFDPLETWRTLTTLAATVTPGELDSLPPEKLLTRLFAAYTVNLQPARDLRFACTCSRDKSATALNTVPRPEVDQILSEDGVVEVTCEFCGHPYRFDQIDVAMLFAAASSQPAQPEPPVH